MSIFAFNLLIQVLNALAESLPELVGGSADLAGSNCTNLKVLSLYVLYQLQIVVSASASACYCRIHSHFLFSGR